MDERRARELAALAHAAGELRGQPDAIAAPGLRAAADEIGPAVDLLLDVDPEAALTLVADLGAFWQDAGLVADGRAIAERAVSRELEPSSPLARARLTAAELAFRQGDQAAATGAAEAAIGAADAVDDRTAASLGWSMLARVAFRDEDAARMEAASARALELAGDDTLARRGALHMLAWAAHTAGDIPEARRRFETSLAYRREVGAGLLSEIVEIGNIAELDLDAGDIPLAAAGLRSVLAAAAELDNRYLLVNTMPAVATLAAASGSDVAAAELFGVGDSLQERSGLIPDPGGERAEVRAAVAGRLGSVAFEAARQAGAALADEAALQRAIETCERLADPGAMAG